MYGQTHEFSLPRGCKFESSQGPNIFLSMIKENSVNLAIVDSTLISDAYRKIISTTKPKKKTESYFHTSSTGFEPTKKLSHIL